MDMKERIAQKRASQAASIPKEWCLSSLPPKESGDNALQLIRNARVLTQKEMDITENVDAELLLKKLASKELSSAEVTTAFCKRAALAHQLTNCCTEMFFDEALESARQADAHLARTGETLGPLHGLPVSLKDVFRVKGHDATVGWVALAGRPVPADGAVAHIIRGMGGILYVKTNVPQSMMSMHSIQQLMRRHALYTDAQVDSERLIQSSIWADIEHLKHEAHLGRQFWGRRISSQREREYSRHRD